MAHVISISNQKGGVSKSTVCANLAIGLARKGKKVLVIDGDSQGSLTTSLGWWEPKELTITLATVMGKVLEDLPVEANEGILSHNEGIDIMPSNIELSGVEVMLVNAMSRETILRQYINSIKEKYEYILLDNSPSLGMMTINALAAADSILIPVQAQYLSLKGLELLLQSIAKIRRNINPKLSVMGILITMVDSRTNYAKDIISIINEIYGEKLNIFKTKIPFSVRLSEISSLGKSIYTHDSGGKSALAFEKLVEEVLYFESQQ